MSGFCRQTREIAMRTDQPKTNRHLRTLLLTLFAVVVPGLAPSATLAQTFTPVTDGPVVTDGRGSRSVNWIDINNDGWIDLFVTNGKSGGENNMLYINQGDGSFTQVDTGAIVTDGSSSDGASFGDWNNDGYPDAAVVNWYNQFNFLYTADGDGAWVSDAGLAPGIDQGYSEACSWADYDNDGHLDLFVANSAGDLRNYLYHNNGDGTFDRVLTGPIATDAAPSRLGAWGDYDNDGDLDLYVANESNTNNNLYENLGGGLFNKITTGEIVTDGSWSWGASWGDYDNDGYLDLFVSNNSSHPNRLYHNNGNGTFTRIISGDLVTIPNYSAGSAWADVDNDGDLDLYVANGYSRTSSVKRANELYLNDGTGTFTRDSLNAAVADSGWSYGCAFADYDNDGDQDLMVARWQFETENNTLYRNDDAGGNNWVILRCIGTVSNNSAIGARVTVVATINGAPVRQTREISSTTGYCGQGSLDAAFGLGDATMIDSVIIRWPSGLQTVVESVAPNQLWTSVEGDSWLGVGLDSDRDGFPDEPSPTSPTDNCPYIHNRDQTDSDWDGMGDVCDLCPTDPYNDEDGDGLCADIDNCPSQYNPEQTDTDNDGIGDVCCCLDRGNVDGVNGPGGPVDVSDLTYVVAFLFTSGTTPPCPEQANIDGIDGPGGPVDVSDLTYLVAYLFQSGETPPSCF